MKKQGFTLVEVLIALVILLTGIIASIEAVQRSLQTTSLTQDRIQAHYFAQEGVEFVRFMRDTNILSGAPTWLHDLSSRCSGASGCQISGVPFAASPPTACAGTCDPVYFDGTIYGGSGIGGSPTKFIRTIRIDVNPLDTDEAVVSVEIEWNNRGQSYTYELEQTIRNWSG